MDICWNIHWRWVKTSGNVMWLQMSEGTCAFGQGNDITACRHQQIVKLKIDATTHRTGSWLARPNMGGVAGKYPSVSGRGTNQHLPPWCRVLPPIWRGTLTTSRQVASYPCSAEWVNDNYKNWNYQKPELPNSWNTRAYSPKERGGRLIGHPKLWTTRQCCYLFVRKNCNRQHC